MFSEPITITVNGVGKVLNKVKVIAQGNTNGSIYQSQDENWVLTISHQRLKDKVRTLTKFDQRVIAADPLTADQDYMTLSEQHVTDRPLVGFAQIDVERHIAGFNDWQKLNATQLKLYGQES